MQPDTTRAQGVRVRGDVPEDLGFASAASASEIVRGCRMVDLPVVHDARGNLTYVENASEVPFAIERVYYLYDVPGGQSRAGHAHRQLQQLVIAASGSFDVLLDDGYKRRTVTLNRAYHGLLMSNSVWRELHNFSSGAFCLVLASMPYDESDYIRDYTTFLESVRGTGFQASVDVREDEAGQWTL